MERVLLKLSGEALSNSGTGISATKVEAAALEIKELAATGTGIAIVCGAGNMWRGRDAAENHMERTLADSIGMLGTIMNALALENALKNVGLKAITFSAVPLPTLVKLYTKRDASEYLEKGYIVLCAGGTGSPYFSTDTASALRALELGCSKILMAKNGTDGVYDSDPRKNKDAKRYTKVTFDELLEKHLEVMDLTAASLCQSNHVDILVFDMNVKGNIGKIISHPEIGTCVTTK